MARLLLVLEYESADLADDRILQDIIGQLRARSVHAPVDRAQFVQAHAAVGEIADRIIDAFPAAQGAGRRPAPGA